MVIQLLILGILLLVVPVIVGRLFIKADDLGGNLFFRWVSGQFLLWAGFQLICVPLVLRGRSFVLLVQLFSGYTAALLLLAAGSWIRNPRRSPEKELREVRAPSGRRQGTALWLLFWVLLLFQLVQAVRMSYADTDDAYYVAVSSITQNAETMYQKLPYTGGATMPDMRHGLAPFPIWISFLARLSGMQAVTVAKVALPVALIAMTYAVFYLCSRILFPDSGRQRALFLVFTEILVLFGNTSIYTVENFMIARSRQGKAALGSIVIPFLLLLFLMLTKRVREGKKIPPLFYLLMGTAAVTGCLCSTLGALLVCLAVGIAGILTAVCYRRFGILVPMAACCIPCLAYVVLYLFF